MISMKKLRKLAGYTSQRNTSKKPHGLVSESKADTPNRYRVTVYFPEVRAQKYYGSFPTRKAAENEVVKVDKILADND